MHVFMNGKIVAKEDVMISAFDHGFLYGVGLFETFRIYEHHPFLLDDHIERLNHGLAVLNIKWSYTKADILETIKLVLEANQLSNAYIRFNVSAGMGEIGLQTEPYFKPNVIMFAKPLPPAGEMTEKDAVVLNLKRNTPESLERLKSHHYLNNLLAKREIGNAINQEGLFLTKEGYIAEGIVSNVFWITNGVLYTPAIETGILNGITRQFILCLAPSLGLAVKEGLYSLEDASRADEVFFTNSIQELAPVINFNGKTMPGKKGRWVTLFHKKYQEYCLKLWSRKEL
jgi:4-amino-4-deoxychorismate lyase